MINIFYEPGYAKRKKSYFTFTFNKSVLFNKLVDVCYLLNLPVPDRFISNGPHKLMNNVLKAFRGKRGVVFNQLLYEYSYILQFDNFGEEILKKIISLNKNNSKVIVGPLFTNDQLHNLSKYVKKYKYIKILSPSSTSTNTILNELNLDIDSKKVCTIPTGVISLRNLRKRKVETERTNSCLLYFKNRSERELLEVKTILRDRSIDIDLFEYGKYDTKRLNKSAQKNKFGILLNSTESQGFAVQEIMSFNLPLLVWDQSNSKFEENEITGTSVPYWSDDCGVIVNDLNNLEKSIDDFINNIDRFNAHDLIYNNLTYEKFQSNIMNEFNNIQNN